VGSEPAVATARETRQRVLVGPPKRSRTRFGGPLRDALLRLMKPWTVHQQDVDLMLVSAIDQLNMALRDLDPVRDVAEGWRSLPAAGELELETFEQPVAGRVIGYRSAEAEAEASGEGGAEALLLAPEEVVAERRRPYLRILDGHAPVLDAGCGRGELLDLLRAAGIEASGVEPSAELAAVARAKGHEVAVEGIVEHLEGAGEQSFGAIFTAVALELELRQLARCLALARTRLGPGGPLVAESLNPHSPESLKYALAGPTRSSPLLPEVALALARAAGFAQAFVFHPQGSGDVSVDRHSATHYALVASAPGGQGRPQ
jgi:SAM-dependent methyltransferase